MIGVLLMSYGSARGPDEVPRYLASTRGGRSAPDDLVAEFRRRYEAVGGSPLLAITREQASALERELGSDFRVSTGMRHSPPFIADALNSLVEAGAHEVVAIVLSPQYSPAIMGGYRIALEARSAETRLRIAGPWHDLPEFVDALVARVREALARLGPAREPVPVIFTAHSLPRRVVDSEPGYIAQLLDTARAVAESLGLGEGRWLWAYQSAGHTPEEWLRPDLKEIFPSLRAAGHRDVLVAPVQFVADHLEVLYDLDIAARSEAETAGLGYHRIEMFNTMPAFIRALAAVVRRELAGSPITA
jgi:ferrochelatase